MSYRELHLRKAHENVAEEAEFNICAAEKRPLSAAACRLELDSRHTKVAGDLGLRKNRLRD